MPTSCKMVTVLYLTLLVFLTKSQSIYSSDDEDFSQYGSGGSGDDSGPSGVGPDIDYSSIDTVYENVKPNNNLKPTEIIVDEVDQSHPTTEFPETQYTEPPVPEAKPTAPKEPEIEETIDIIEEEINEIEVVEAKSSSSSSILDYINNFWGEKYFLAALLAGAIIGFIIISLVILFICYTVRKSDQGSYIIDEQLTQKYAIQDYKYAAGTQGHPGGTIVKESARNFTRENIIQ